MGLWLRMKLPRGQDKQCADSMIHDGHVMQRLADGKVVVIGHVSQKIKLSDSQENKIIIIIITEPYNH